MLCPCSAFSPADRKIVGEDTKKMSKSQQLIDTTYTTFAFLVSTFLPGDKKIDEDYAVVHLVLPPHPNHVSARLF
jgi:hypothetical protein